MRSYRRPALRRLLAGALALIALAVIALVALGPASLQAALRAAPLAQDTSLALVSSPASILPGTSGDFIFRLTNNSGADRTFNLTTVPANGLALTFPSGTQVTVANGSQADFALTAVVPPSAGTGMTYKLALLAVSSTPTNLQLWTIFSVLVGAPTPPPTLTPAAYLRLPMVLQGDPSRAPTPIPTLVKISDVFCRDPQYPQDSEYIELRNDTQAAIDIAGWTISNASRSGVSYTFPSYTMERGPNVYLTLYSGIGTNNPTFAEFWWNRSDQIWFVGDRAELRDPAGNLIDTYSVTQSNCPR